MIKEQKERNEFIDFIKGALIIIVILRHVFQISANNSDIDYLCNLMAIIEMPLFIAISGYFSIPIFTNDCNEYKVLKNIVKKTRAYLIPFISFYLLFKIIFLKYYIDMNSILDVFFNITLSLWFLFVIWILGIISSVIYKIVNTIKLNKNLSLVCFTFVYYFLILLMLLIGKSVGFNFMGIKLIVYYSLFYYIGILFRNYELEFSKLFDKKRELITFFSYSVLFIGGFLFKVMAVEDTITNIVIRFLLSLFGIIAFLNIVNHIYDKINDKKSREVMLMIGKNTLELYYVHSFLLPTISLNKADLLMSSLGISNSIISTLYITFYCILILSIIKSSTCINYILLGKKTK